MVLLLTLMALAAFLAGFAVPWFFLLAAALSLVWLIGVYVTV